MGLVLQWYLFPWKSQFCSPGEFQQHAVHQFFATFIYATESARNEFLCQNKCPTIIPETFAAVWDRTFLSECIIAEAVHDLSRSPMPGYFSRVTWLITTFLGYLIYAIASEWWRAICGNIIFPCLCDFGFFQPIISKFQILTSDAWYNLFFALFSLKSRYFRKLKATGFSITSFERAENSTFAAVSLAW
jgi:hypothetical protein